MTDPLDEQITRQGTHYDGTPETGTTDVRAIAAWWDHAEELLQGLIHDTHKAVTDLQTDVDARLTQLTNTQQGIAQDVANILATIHELTAQGTISGTWTFKP